MAKQAVIFDLDGTLLDTLDDLADSGNYVLQQHGFPTHPVDAFRYFVGEGVGALIRRMLPPERRDDETVAQIGQAYRHEYGRRWNAKTRLYDGIAGLLDALTKRGVTMGILSNKPDEFTQMCVAELLSSWTFDVVMGHHEGIARKPDPGGANEIAGRWRLPPSQIVYVGDTATDMQTAVAAEMFPVGVLWGFRDEQELREAGAKALIEHPMKLLDSLSDGER